MDYNQIFFQLELFSIIYCIEDIHSKYINIKKKNKVNISTF